MVIEPICENCDWYEPQYERCGLSEIDKAPEDEACEDFAATEYD